jgi:hypothetical protein
MRYFLSAHHQVCVYVSMCMQLQHSGKRSRYTVRVQPVHAVINAMSVPQLKLH